MFPLAVMTHSGIRLTQAWNAALQLTGVKQEAIARAMGITPSLLATQISGVGHLSVPRLFSAAAKDADVRRFMVVFLPALAEECGMPELAWSLKAVDGFGAFLDFVQTRMVKADLRGERKERMRA